MAGKKPWTQETEQWLLKTAWKTMTLQEIATKINTHPTVVKLFLDEHDIKPITKRDRITGKVLDVYNSGKPFPKTGDLALMFNCSTNLIKSIVETFDLAGAHQQSHKKATKTKPQEQVAAKLKSLQDYDKRIAAQKELRKTFTSYTQSSSDLIDECRGMKTTLRLKTYLTNANV